MKPSKINEVCEDELNLAFMTLHDPKTQVKTHLMCMFQGHLITRGEYPATGP